MTHSAQTHVIGFDRRASRASSLTNKATQRELRIHNVFDFERKWYRSIDRYLELAREGEPACEAALVALGDAKREMMS